MSLFPYLLNEWMVLSTFSFSTLKVLVNIVYMFLIIYPTNSNQAFLNEIVSALDILA